MLPYEQLQHLTADRTQRLEAEAVNERLVRSLRPPTRPPSRAWTVVLVGRRARAHRAAPGH